MDRTYSGGISGLEVFSNVANGGADATFDRFVLGVSVPEPSVISLLLIGGGVLTAWRLLNRARQVKHRKQSGA